MLTGNEELQERTKRLIDLIEENQKLILRIQERLNKLSAGESCDTLLTKKEIKKELGLSEPSFHKWKDYLFAHGMKAIPFKDGRAKYIMRKSDLLKLEF